MGELNIDAISSVAFGELEEDDPTLKDSLQSDRDPAQPALSNAKANSRALKRKLQNEMQLLQLTSATAQAHTSETELNIAESDIAKLAIQYTRNSLEWPALHYAIKQNRIDVADFILQLYPEQATQLTPTISVYKVDIRTASPNVYGYEKGISALELAICGGHTELVAKLLEMGADINEFRVEYKGTYSDYWKGKHGIMNEWIARSPLYWAITQKDSNMVALLLERGASLTPCLKVRKDKSLWEYVTNSTSALKLAADQESTEIFEQLLTHQAKGSSLDDELVSLFRNFVTNPENLPALHYAVFVEDIATYKLLLEYGFDVNDQGNSSKSLIERAVETKDRDFLNPLLTSEKSVKAALAHAVSIGDADLVKHLIERTAAGPNLLKEALKAGDLDVANIILNQPHSMKVDGEALILAIRKGCSDLVKRMLELGYSDKRAIVTAIETKDKEIFFLLFNKGEGRHDLHAIRQAIQFNQPIMIEALIKRDAPSDEEISGYMRQAIRLGLKDIVTLFLDYRSPSDEQLTQYKRCAVEYNRPNVLSLFMNR